MLKAKSIVFSIYIVLAFANHGLPRVSESPDQIQTIQRVVHIDPPAPDDSRYVYVPFEVPKDAVRIAVDYEYDRTNNTLDIGVFDVRSTGSTRDASGFRGWSGGRRSEFFISSDEATPGYLPGSLPAGRWQLILGLYRVGASGVDVSLKIEIKTDRKSNSRLKSKLSTAKTRHEELVRRGEGLRWWRGDLHMHTVHSDGDWTIAELISTARKIGLDFICITDHNTASHHREIDTQDSSPLLVLRGEEITTYGGHANAWGLPSGTWVDFRIHPGDAARMSQIAAQVHKLSALISINHPFGACGGCSWSYQSSVNNFDAIEVWNGSWDRIDDEALAMWNRELMSGRRLTAIASSDSHRAVGTIGNPTTKVYAATLSQESLFDGIRRGRVYLTSEVSRPVVKFEAERVQNGPRWLIGDEVRLGASGKIRLLISTALAPVDATVSVISNGQAIHSFAANGENTIEVDCPQDAYFRVEVRDRARSMLALTNPIYVKIPITRKLR